jgi:hypothetical protein
VKTRKLPGFGSLGVEVYDTDLRTIGADELRELGFISLEQLLVVIGRESVCGISRERFHEICTAWLLDSSADFALTRVTFEKMLGKYGSERGPDGLPIDIDPVDRRMVEEGYRIVNGIEHLQGMSRVTGKRDEDGNTTGMFAEGELEWHCNNQGAALRAPGVGLIGWEGATGSRTEFLNTADAYQDLSPEWQSICDELIAVHRFIPGAIAPGVSEVQERLLKFTMCPDDDTEIPLVMRSPAGIKGLHFAFTSIHHFKGMSQAESEKTIEYLKEHVIRDKYIYGHDWVDGDMLLFDNSITLHRRPTKDCSKRLMYRMAFNYDGLLAERAASRSKQAS